MYHTISPYYNWVMSHVNYRKWAGYLQQIISEHNLSHQSIFELAAGTCPFQKHSINKKSKTIYSDISFSMIRQGKPDSNRIVADSCLLPIKYQFDLVLMIYDSFNYLQSTRDVSKCLQQVHNILPKGGHFIFDITTEYNSKTFFSESVLVDNREDCHISRESWYDQKSKKQYNQFTFFIQGEGSDFYQKAVETHVQKIYSVTELKKLIRRASFQLVSTLDGFTLNKPNRYSDRIHFILRKK